MSDEALRRGLQILLGGGVGQVEDEQLARLFKLVSDEFHKRDHLVRRARLEAAIGERLTAIHYGRFGGGSEVRRLVFGGAARRQRCHAVSGLESRLPPLRGAVAYANCGGAQELLSDPEDAEKNLTVIEHWSRFTRIPDHCVNCANTRGGAF